MPENFIKVLFFASLRETTQQDTVNLSVDTMSSPRELWKLTASDTPIPENTLVAINQEYATLDSQVKPGDEVAFFPPVTGG